MLMFGTLRRQLVWGVVGVHALMMSMFVADLTLRQRAMLHEQQIELTTALAQSVATSSAGWLAANDVSGLQEIVDAQRRYPELAYAMVLDPAGRVLAHTDRLRLGKHLHDLPEKPALTDLSQGPELVDVVAPAVLAGRHVGWVRVGLGQKAASARLSRITRDGALYALGAILIGSFIAGVMGKRFTRRLHAIQKVVDAVRVGSQRQRVELQGADEAAQLAVEFNGMLDTLADRARELGDSRESLRRSEERFDLAMRGANDGLWDWDLVENTVYYSHRWKEMLGYGPDEVGESPDEFFGRLHPDDVPVAQAAVAAHRNGETELYQVVCRCRHRGGQYRWILTRGIGVRDAQGAIVRMVGTHTDITDRKRLEEDLQSNAHRLRQLFEDSPVPLMNVDFTEIAGWFDALRREGVEDLGAYFKEHHEALVACADRVRVAAVNRGALALFGGRSKEELVAGFARTFTERSFEDFRDGLVLIWQGEREFAVDTELQSLDGRRVFVALRLSRISEPSREEVIISLVDITERKRAEHALRKLSRAVEQSPVSIVITDTQGRIEYVNPRFTEVTGYPANEALGRTPNILKSGEMEPAKYQQLWATIAAGREWRGELCNRRKTGELFWEQANITPVFGAKGEITNYLAVKEDITDRRRLESELRQAQKMDAFGQLAGGVAHDFNNLLTVILGSVSALSHAQYSKEQLTEALGEVELAASRAAELTRQLLMFSRRQAPRMRDVELNHLVGNMTKMLHRLIGEHITLQARYAPGAVRVSADPGMLEQVILNLAVNARDAMPGGGMLTVETAFSELAEDRLCGYFRVPAGSYVRLSVEDTGCGVPPSDLPRIFEPFFTTKDIGRGTGLGLATVFGIVQQHQAHIELESTVGKGTTFRIYLPMLHHPSKEAGEAERLSSVRGGHESILLVEDEELVRGLARRILEGQGYRVVQAVSAVHALRVWAEKRDSIALVLTDVVMPEGMSGLELAEKLLVDRPELKVIFSSGYSDKAPGAAGERPFLAKPYGAAELLRIVRSTLDEA